MSRILYHERTEKWNSSVTYEHVTDYVEVTVQSWSCADMIPDIVVHYQTMVDRELTIDSRTAYAHGMADAVFIRMGIAKFDELLASHPNLS